MITGLSYRFVTLLYTGLASAGLLLALAWYLDFGAISVILSFTFPVLCFGLWVFVIRRERKDKWNA